jgi:phage-related protein
VKPINWVKAARRAFDGFPGPVRMQIASDLAIVAAGANPDTVKPLKGFTEGVFEVVTNDRSGTYRTVYALRLEDAVWVIHAWQKKSTMGIKTAPHDIELIRKRIVRLKEELR